MARPLRVEFDGAVYHVMSRGIEGRSIVLDDEDRDGWLDTLARTAERFGWKLLAYCLLDNHFHLFVRTPACGLAAGMRQLNGDYAGYFNRRHKRLGPLMQGRYKSVLVENESHWLELSRYVHLNPLRAGLCKAPEDWKWSSYRCYHRPVLRPEWLDCAGVLSEFGREEAKARRAYREYVAAGIGRKLDNPVSRAVHGLVLGSDAFVKKVRKLVGATGKHPEVPQLGRLWGSEDLGKLVAQVAKSLKADTSRWEPGRRIDDPARALCAYAARRATGARLSELAKALGYRSPSAVTSACRRAEEAMRSDRVRRQVEKLVADAATKR
jgi:REP element-mobilizing transposase RayT